jgi:hypothetical protein
MPDISMCNARIEDPAYKNGRCPFAENCYRHMAKPSPGRQSWFEVAPFKAGLCDYFVPVAGEEVPT